MYQQFDNYLKAVIAELDTSDFPDLVNTIQPDHDSLAELMSLVATTCFLDNKSHTECAARIRSLFLEAVTMEATKSKMN